VAVGMFMVSMWVLKQKLEMNPRISNNRLQYFQQGAISEKFNYVDTKFLTRLIQLLKVAFGKRELFIIILLTAGLIGRTFLTLYLTNLNSKIVKSMMQGKFNSFLKRVSLY
jgi:hypothetical protein